MEIWDSLNRRYLDFIKKRGARREESWLFRGLREPGRGRAEELACRALGPGSGFQPKKGKAGKKCEEAAGGGGAQRPRDGGQHGRIAAPGAGAATGVAVARVQRREPRCARYAAGSPARPSLAGRDGLQTSPAGPPPHLTFGVCRGSLQLSCPREWNRGPGPVRRGNAGRGEGEPLFLRLSQEPAALLQPAQPGPGASVLSRFPVGGGGARTPRRFRLWAVFN